MRDFLFLTVLAGCGGNTTIDARPMIDASMVDTAIDASDPPADCTTYCTTVQTNCIDGNAQYPGANATATMQSCMAACSSFPEGKASDTSGNTRGCRIHFAMAASAPAEAANDCIAAGPLGDHIKSTPTAFCTDGDICTSFCALEIQACGTVDTPLPGDPKDDANNPIYQYQDLSGCLDACHLFNRISPYSPSSQGNSLACRMVQSINAALSIDPNARMDCIDTGAVPNGICVGGASP